MELDNLKTPQEIADAYGITAKQVIKLIHDGAVPQGSYTKLSGRYVIDERAFKLPVEPKLPEASEQHLLLTKQLLSKTGTSPMDFIRKFGTDTAQGYQLAKDELTKYYTAEQLAPYLNRQLQLTGDNYLLTSIQLDDSEDLKESKLANLIPASLTSTTINLASLLSPRDFIRVVGTVKGNGYGYQLEQSVVNYCYQPATLKKALAVKQISHPDDSSYYETDALVRLLPYVTELNLSERTKINSYRNLVAKYVPVSDFVHECGAFKLDDNQPLWELPLDTVARYYNQEDIANGIADDHIRVTTKTEHQLYYLTYTNREDEN